MEQNKHYMECTENEIHIPVRFTSDGAKMGKRQSAVKGICFIMNPGHHQPHTPDDEMTLYLFTGNSGCSYTNINNK